MTKKDPFREKYFEVTRFYRTVEGDIGRLVYEADSLVSLRMLDGEVEVFPTREIAPARLTEKEKDNWYLEACLDYFCPTN